MIGYVTFSDGWMSVLGTEELGVPAGSMFWPSTNCQGYGGGDLQVWAGEANDPANTALKWSIFDSQNTTLGADRIWWLVVAKLPWAKREARFDKAMLSVARQIHAKAPAATIYLSAVPQYSDEVYATGTLNNVGIQQSIDGVARFLASPPRYVKPGPVMPLLDVPHCLPMPEHHPNEAGRALLGQALIDFFGS